MELIRTSLRTYCTNRHKTGASRSQSLDSHFKPGDSGKSESVRDSPLCSMVRSIQRSNFDDLCRIYPCHEPSRSAELPQQSADRINDAKQSHVDFAAKIDQLRTADVVKILLQPAVLDTVVAELENSVVLSE